ADRIDVRKAVIFHPHQIKQRACRRIRGNYGSLRSIWPCLQATRPTQEARASLPFDGAHGKPPKLLLERASFGHLPFPASDRNATFQNAVSARIELQTAGRPRPGDREAGEIARGWESAPNPARCHRLREDLYYRKRNPRDRPA